MYKKDSPAQINLAAMFGGAASGNLSEDQVGRLERMASRSGFGSKIAQGMLNKYQSTQAPKLLEQRQYHRSHQLRLLLMYLRVCLQVCLQILKILLKVKRDLVV